MRSILTFAITFFWSVQLFSQTTRLVPQEFSSIQNAMNLSKDGDIVLVSPGTYYENILWTAEMNGVVLRSTDGPAVTIIDADNLGKPIVFEGSNILILTEMSIDSSSILDGFTIKNGLSHTNGKTEAGGIYIDRASPTLLNLIIENNRLISDGARGGGIYFYRSQSLIDNCIVRNNSVFSQNGPALGGGLYVYESSINITNCNIKSNSAESNNWGHGGGIYSDNSEIFVSDCIIEGNSVDGGGSSYGGGVYINTWAIGFSEDATQFNKCTFKNNKCLDSRKDGAALYAANTDLAVELTNCLIHGNRNGDSSINLFRSSAKIAHCTIMNNNSGINCDQSELELENTILWDNNNSITTFSWNNQVSIISVNHSIIEGGWEGEENLDSDPLLISDKLLIPTKKSPSLNAGKKNVSLVDITGDLRPRPGGSAPDIGAYEIAQNFTYVLSQFYYDENQNGTQDVGEVFIARGAITVENEVFENTTRNGIYIPAQLGQLKIEYHTNNTEFWMLSSSPNQYTFDVIEEDFADTIYFGIYPTRSIKDVVAGLYSPPLRCSRTVTGDYFIKNEGTTRESGVLWAHLDPLVSEVEPLIAPDYIEDDRMGWISEDLLPGESFIRKVAFTVPGVTTVEQGQLLKFTSVATLLDNQQVISTFCYEDDVRCSYDPNDKLVNPDRLDALVIKNEPVIYTIRFQNVGNDYADDVIVRDTLDKDFDFESFKLLTTSHPDILRYTLSDNGILSFNFHQIFLPDSTTDATGSNGYIMYSIKPDSTINNYTKLENTAHIYFDFNPAIVTNTTENSAIDKFPVLATNEDKESSLLIHPNPSRGMLNLSSEYDYIQVLDSHGKLACSVSNSRKVNISDSPDGIYFIRAFKNSKVFAGKVSLMKN